MRVGSSLALVALLLAGCSGDEETAPPQTSTQVVTVTEPDAAETTPNASAAGSLADVVERVLPSVVNVRTKSFGGGEGDGSGVVLDRAGIILTNNHVIEGTTSVTVVFNDDRHKTPLAGTVIGTAPERDLAVIHVAANDLIPLGLARSSSLRLGDAVFAVGFPLGLGGPSVTSGIVSGLDRTIDGTNGKLTGLLQTDAAINPGNSGGPLVDRLGRLVGINTAGVRLAEAENVSFAIAIDEALPVIARIRNQMSGDADVVRRRLQLGRLRLGSGAARTRRLGPRRRDHGRPSGRAGRGCRPGGRRRDHRRRRRPDRLRRRPGEAARQAQAR